MELSSKHYMHFARLFEMQLQGILEDLAGPAENLSSIFTNALLELFELKAVLDDAENVDEEAKLKLEKVIESMQQCIVSIQFFDSKRQRLEHVSDGIGELDKISNDAVHNSNQSAWKEFDEKIKAQYKMSIEREIYNKYLEECEVAEDSENYLAVENE